MEKRARKFQVWKFPISFSAIIKVVSLGSAPPPQRIPLPPLSHSLITHAPARAHTHTHTLSSTLSHSHILILHAPARAHIHTHKHSLTHTLTHTHTSTHHARTRARTHTHSLFHAHTHTHTHSHANYHTHTHTLTTTHHARTRARTHTHPLSHAHTHSHSHTHSHTLWSYCYVRHQCHSPRDMYSLCSLILYCVTQYYFSVILRTTSYGLRRDSKSQICTPIVIALNSESPQKQSWSTISILSTVCSNLHQLDT